ncbi:MAG: DNA/RNA nuclease SfsA, partial [Myxococcales bacterium]|nr:DNA/RNA nuclease SfsA [Myxococcales bacterium]
QLAGFTRRWRQVPYGAAGRSRVDLLLSRGGRAIAGAGRVDRQGDARVYVEVKNTTLVYQTGEDPRAAGRRLAAFPDAVTERGRKHLHELQHVVTQEGQRAALVLCVQRSDCDAFAPADAIDPAWGSAARAAVAAGVEVYALCGAFAPAGITLDRRLPIEL